jgi:hypothetical protein
MIGSARSRWAVVTAVAALVIRLSAEAIAAVDALALGTPIVIVA